MEKSIYYLIQKFQKGTISRRELFREISPFILKIPVLKGYYEEDIRYDFFAYVMSKIEKMLTNYEIRKDISFEAWFFLVLSRQFYNFLNKKIRPKNDNFSSREAFLTLDYLTEDYYNNTQIENDNVLKFDFSFLTEKERDILAFKYGIGQENNDVYEETSKIILDKIEKKKKIEQKIYDKYMKLLTVQKKISRTYNENEIINLKNKEIKIRKYKRRLENIFKSYYIYPSNNWVGEKLGISEGTVGAYLFKIKTKIIKRNFSEFNYNLL